MFQEAQYTRERDQRIDFFRGLSLLIIFIDHIEPNRLAAYTLQRFAFFDAADVFVFISGYVIGQVYTRELLRGGFEGCFVKAVRRFRQLYGWHLAVAAATVVLLYCFSRRGVYLNTPSLYLFLKEPLQTALMIATFRHTPGSLSILPLYACLTAVTPFIVYCVDKRNRIFIACSIATYAGVQLLPVNPATPHFEGLLRFFNVFAWQLIFVIGIWLGNRQVHGLSFKFPYARRSVLLASAATFCGAFVRLATTSPRMAAMLHTNFWLDMLPKLVPLTNKITAGPLRLFNLVVVLILVCRISRHSRIWTGWLARRLIHCGKHSLIVFFAGMLLSYSATLVVSTHPGNMMIAIYASLIGCTLLLFGGHLAAEWTTANPGFRIAGRVLKAYQGSTCQTNPHTLPACDNIPL